VEGFSRWLGDSEGLRHYFHLIVGNFFWVSLAQVQAQCSGLGMCRLNEVGEVIS
jgi:hypothetical protein